MHKGGGGALGISKQISKAWSRRDLRPGGMIWSMLSCLRDLLLVLFPSVWPRADLADSACQAYPLGRDALKSANLGGKG